jgi:FkbM family methyltransferase
MTERLLNFSKQLLPNGLCEYSVRRHEYMRCGFGAGAATLLAFSLQRYRMFGDSRLNLVPSEILHSLRSCVDAGAHRGMWTETLLDLSQPNRVILVECEPRLVLQLRDKFGDREHVSIVDAALSDHIGTATFYQLRHPASSSLLQPRPEIAKEFEPTTWDVIGTSAVRTISYDELVAEEDQVSILKLDIQGAEARVLAKSQSGLAKTLCIILEVNFTRHYSEDATFPELHALLAGKGFGLYRLSSVYHRGGRALFADAVYVREEILGNLGSPQIQSAAPPAGGKATP